jgi:hypothetical protein
VRRSSNVGGHANCHRLRTDEDRDGPLDGNAEAGRSHTHTLILNVAITSAEPLIAVSITRSSPASRATGRRLTAWI